MNTLYDVTTAPIPYSPERGQEARALFAEFPDNLRNLIAGTAGCSPYLDQLLKREADWLKSSAQLDLDRVFASILADIAGESFENLSDALRVAKRRAALLIALADLGGLWCLEQVTGALTALADRAVQVSLVYLVSAEIARGKLPGCCAKDAADGAGMVALAMGKMGAGELNYSSDIDLIMLFDESRHAPEHHADLRAGFIRITQRMVKMLSATTGEGYVFRTDLRLRPDPSVTPVCISMEAAERYYESLGRTWERAAFIKARPCAGAIDAGWAFLERLRPFIWRKHLDFAAIEDAHDMRLRIRAHKNLHGPVSVPGHDMKLGRGGIREIEFFTQTRQIICGGRDQDIRHRQTLTALKALRDKSWVEPDVETALGAAYIAYRTLEHRLQMLDDAQTHKIPENLEKRQRLAAFCGADDLEVFENTIKERLQNTHNLIEKFFTQKNDEEKERPEPAFARPEFVADILAKWEGFPALRSVRARQIFARLRPEILHRLSGAGNPEEALLQFDAFLAGLPAGVQLFALFEANPHLLDLLVDICATAPQLARYLGQNAQVLDAVISADFFAPLPELATLRHALSLEIGRCEYYEDVLDSTRRWVKENQFKIGVHLLRQTASAEETAEAYSNVAEACLCEVFPHVCKDFARRYGPPPGRGAMVVAMGKLGSGEMTATSDLDLIVIYDAENQTHSTGKRPLPVTTYYGRLTQALVSALSVPTAEGALFEVDMRLRPSGRKGPVATSLRGFADYQLNEAWTWEHLALTRARALSGDAGLVGDVKEVICKVLHQRTDSRKTLEDVQQMRQKLAKVKSTSAGLWALKDGPGRLMDLELLLQTGAVLFGISDVQRPIDMLPKLMAQGWISTDDSAAITKALILYRQVQQVTRLAIKGTPDPAGISKGLRALMSGVVGLKDVFALEVKLAQTALDMTAIIEKTLAIPIAEGTDDAR